MPDFLEERLSDLVRYGASYQDDYSVTISETAGGQEYPILNHPFPRRKFDISYLLDNDKTYTELQGIYHRAHGKFAAFRVRCYDEWSSNGRVSPPTAFDQPCGLVSTGIYQLRKYYGRDKAAGATGYPYRTIHKPVAGTVLAAIGTAALAATQYSADATTGRITMAANKTSAITGITKASNAVLTVASHTVANGDSFQVSAVVGMTQINGLRATVISHTPTSITTSINSTGFSTYTSGGVFHTLPQAGEAVTAGFEFDFPVRFNTAMPIGQDFPGYRSVDSVELIERLNP